MCLTSTSSAFSCDFPNNKDLQISLSVKHLGSVTSICACWHIFDIIVYDGSHRDIEWPIPPLDRLHLHFVYCPTLASTAVIA